MKENRKNLRIFLFIFLLFWGIFIFDSIEVFAGKIDKVVVEDKTMNDSIEVAIEENVNWLPDFSFTNGGVGDKFCDDEFFTWTDVRKNVF